MIRNIAIGALVLVIGALAGLLLISTNGGSDEVQSDAAFAAAVRKQVRIEAREARLKRELAAAKREAAAREQGERAALEGGGAERSSAGSRELQGFSELEASLRVRSATRSAPRRRRPARLGAR